MGLRVSGLISQPQKSLEFQLVDRRDDCPWDSDVWAQPGRGWARRRDSCFEHLCCKKETVEEATTLGAQHFGWAQVGVLEIDMIFGLYYLGYIDIDISI